MMTDGMWVALFWTLLVVAVVLFTLSARNWGKAKHLSAAPSPDDGPARPPRRRIAPGDVAAGNPPVAEAAAADIEERPQGPSGA